MLRFPVVILVVFVSQYALCSLLPAVESDLKDDQKNKVVLPPVETQNLTDELKCAKIGEFCANHSDCCTNACLGYLKRCVSGRELDVIENEEIQTNSQQKEEK